MKLRALILVVLVFFIGCGGDSRSGNDNSVLEDAITFELSISGNVLMDHQYLLAEPWGIAVSENDDIIVADESRLKIFNKSGDPLKIVGGPGSGPGEFTDFISRPFVSSGGYIVVQYGVGNPTSSYNLFDSNYNFLKNRKLRGSELEKRLRDEYEWDSVRILESYHYSIDEQLFYVRGRTKDNYNKGILYFGAGKITEIVQYEDHNDFMAIMFVKPIFPDGRLLMALLPEKRVVYSQTEHHVVEEQGKHYYRIFIRDLVTDKEVEIKHEFTPVPLPESYKNEKLGYADELPEEFKQHVPKFEEAWFNEVSKISNYPSLQIIRADQNKIFAFTFEKNERNEFVVDVFDASKGKYIRSLYMPFIPKVIKNGYAYDLIKGKDVFPEVRKYKISPAVYR